MKPLILGLARGFAFAGGLVLTALILLTCLSVLGRSLNGILHGDFLQGAAPGFADALLATGVGPINGDFEIVEAGMAFAIIAFLPLCQLHAAHASVDIFVQALSRRVQAALRFVIEVVFAAVLVVFVWQLYLGSMSKMRSGQTTLLLEFPVWWSYMVSLVAMAVAAFVAVYVAWMRGVEAFSGQAGLLPNEGAEH